MQPHGASLGLEQRLDLLFQDGHLHLADILGRNLAIAADQERNRQSQDTAVGLRHLFRSQATG